MSLYLDIAKELHELDLKFRKEHPKFYKLELEYAKCYRKYFLEAQTQFGNHQARHEAALQLIEIDHPELFKQYHELKPIHDTLDSSIRTNRNLLNFLNGMSYRESQGIGGDING